MEKPFLNQIDLSRRWGISPRTLERWRWLGEGPVFVKLGGRVAYRFEDIEAYEQAHMRNSTSDDGLAIKAGLS
jgi:predicted site-specific integrase-resolvase